MKTTLLIAISLLTSCSVKVGPDGNFRPEIDAYSDKNALAKFNRELNNEK